MDHQEYANPQQHKPSVVLTGTAKEGKAGPPVGLVDIGVSEGAYLFRVALPGVQRDNCKVRCDIQRDGKVYIQGVITEAGVLRNSPSEYQMKVQQLCPPGPFTVTFNLPGPVDPRLFSPNFRPDGILEVIVMKYRIPDVQVNGFFEKAWDGSRTWELGLATNEEKLFAAYAVVAIKLAKLRVRPNFPY